jgi:hypothetical protein
LPQPSYDHRPYKRYRFPPEVISYCVWLYYRFGMSLRNVSKLMLVREIEASHEAIRLWTLRLLDRPENVRRLADSAHVILNSTAASVATITSRDRRDLSSRFQRVGRKTRQTIFKPL